MTIKLKENEDTEFDRGAQGQCQLKVNPGFAFRSFDCSSVFFLLPLPLLLFYLFPFYLVLYHPTDIIDPMGNDDYLKSYQNGKSHHPFPFVKIIRVMDTL